MTVPWGPSSSKLAAEFARLSTAIEIMRAGILRLPDTGYVGNRCGWYPARPKRKRPGR